MSLHLSLHHATPSKFFFSVLFHQDHFQASGVLSLIQACLGEYPLAAELYYPKENPLLEYYAQQMGEQSAALKRFFCYTQSAIPREKLIDVKLRCMDLERKSYQPYRSLNLDPGFVALEQMVLSSHKPYAHRLWVRDGVYLELEYLFKNNNWVTLPWTYPDYAHDEKKEYFLSMRKMLL